MIFFKHPRTIPKLNISINGNPVEQVTNFNFLCITHDQNLIWNDHISKIFIKVARVIGIMNKLKHIFPHQILRTLYNFLIHPHLIYGLYIWGFSPKRLTILQKKAVSILARTPYMYISHTSSIFKDLKILKLKTNIICSSTSCTTRILIIVFLHILTGLPPTMIMLNITMI